MAILHLPKIILYIYTNIIKICCNGNTVRESSNWIQLELFQLPPMHDLCMQAQQKLHVHQSFTQDWLRAANKRSLNLSKPNRWWQYTNFQSEWFLTSSLTLQLPANLSGTVTTKTYCPRMQRPSNRQMALKLVVWKMRSSLQGKCLPTKSSKSHTAPYLGQLL